MLSSPFVGRWRLLSFEVKAPSGEVTYPLGKDVLGSLVYSQDGYMTASVMRANRAHFSSEEMWAGKPEEKVSAFDSYISYCGRYEVKEGKIIHHVELSLFPNWSGADQERHFEFAGGRLALRTPFISAVGLEQTVQLIWQRV